MSILSTVEVFLETGFVFSIIAMGYYISYHILDFPDLTVEGTFLSGAVTFGLFASKGLNPWLGLLAAMLVGSLFGALTGVLHVALKIRPLLCGILVSTSLITVNLIAVSAGKLVNFLRQNGQNPARLLFRRGRSRKGEQYRTSGLAYFSARDPCLQAAFGYVS